MSSRCLSPSLASDFSDHDNDDDVSYALPSSLTMRTSPNTTTTTSTTTSRKRRSLFPGTSGNHSVRGVAGVEDDDNDNDSIQNMGEWRRAQYETSPRKQLKQYWQLCYGGIASPHGSKDPQSLPNITPRPSVSFKSTTTSTITPNKGCLKQSPKPSDSAAPTLKRGDAAFSTPQRVQSSCAPITTTTTQSKPSGCVTVSSSKTVRFAPSQAAEYEREAPTGAGVKRLSPDQAAQLYPVVVEPSQDVDDPTVLRIRQQTKDNHAILSAWDESFEDFIFQDDDDDIDRTPTVFSKRKRRTSKMFSPKPKNLLLDTETKEENALFPSDIKDDYDSSKSSPPTDSAGEVLHSNIADIIKQITQFMSNYSTTDFLYLLDATYSSSSSSLQNSDTLVRVIHEIENACDKMEVSAHVVPQELHGSLFLLSYKSLLQLEIDALSKVHSELSNQIHQVHQSSRDLTELETNVFQRTGNLPDLIRREHNAVCSLHCKYRSTKKLHSALLWGLTSDIHRSLVIAPQGNDADESLVVHLSSFGGSFITEIHWDLLGDVVHIRPYLPEDLPCLCLYQAFHSCLFYSYFDTNIPYLEKLSVSDCVQYIKLFLNRLEVATRDIQGLDKLYVKQVSYGSTHIEVQLLLPDEHHVKVSYTNRPSLTTSCRPIEAVLSGKSGSRAVRIPSDLYPLQSLVQQLHMTDHDV